MASLATTQTSAPSGTARSVLDLVAVALSKLTQHFARLETEKQLRSMNDHQLYDIGIERADIHKLVWADRA